MATRSPLARAAAAPLGAAILAAGPASAQEKKTLTISMWGFNGDKLEAFLFKPFKEKHNVDIVLETGNAGDRLNKVKIRGGGVDLIYLSDVFAQVGLEEKLFEKIDTSRVPNVKDLYPAAQAPLGEGQGIAYTLGRYGIIYDSAKVNITSWAVKPRRNIGLSAGSIANPYIKLGGTLASPRLDVKPIEAAASTGAAVATAGLTILFRGIYNRITAEKKVCVDALRKSEKQQAAREARKSDLSEGIAPYPQV